MKSKAYYFSPSLPLMKENIRRFWTIPALFFLVYFFSLVFPILLSYNDLGNLYSYIDLCFSNHCPIFTVANVFFPVLTSVIVFRYLQSSGSATVIHAMPFTRIQLFVSNALSGLLLVITPVLLNGLILFAIKKPTFTNFPPVTSDSYGVVGVGGNLQPSLQQGADAFTQGNILSWLSATLVTIIFVYAISLLAGLVTGNALMHFATAGLLNFTLPILYLIGLAYCSHYLYGFVSGPADEFFMNFSPVLKVFSSREGNLTTIFLIIYLLIAIVLSCLAAFLYSKRKLEKAGDSLVFSFMHPILSYLLAFFGMTAFGFFFLTLNNDSPTGDLKYLVAGYLIGGILCFIVGQMLVKKTPRIFNKKSLRSLVIFGFIATLLIMCLQFDITGFEKRMPKAASVERSYFSIDSLENFAGFATVDPQDPGSYSGEPSLYLKDPNNIQALQNFHKEIINHHNEWNYNKDSVILYNRPAINNVEDRNLFYRINISYDLGKGNANLRGYNVPASFVSHSKDLKTLFESKEYKEMFLFEKANTKKNFTVIVSPNGDMNPNVKLLTLNESESADLLSYMDKDFKAQTFEEFVSMENPCAFISASFPVVLQDGREITNSQLCPIPKTYKNSIKWLADHAYEVDLRGLTNIFTQ